MRADHYVSQVLQLNATYRLEDRYPHQISPVVRAAEKGMLSEGMAKAYLHQWEPLIRELRRVGNYLPRAPDTDELPDFDFTLAELIENPGVRVGIRLSDSARHVLAAGASGTGKSTLLRAIIHGVDKINKQRSRPDLHHRPVPQG